MMKLNKIQNRWQKSSENTSDSEKQKLILQNDQVTILDNLIVELMQNYSNLSISYQKELDKTHQLQHDYEEMIRKKDSEISKLNIELADWNTQFKRLLSKIESLLASQSHLDPQEGDQLEKIREQELNTIIGDDGIIHIDENKMYDEGDAQDLRDKQQIKRESTDEDWQDLRKEFMNAIREITSEQKQASQKNNNNN